MKSKLLLLVLITGLVANTACNASGERQTASRDVKRNAPAESQASGPPASTPESSAPANVSAAHGAKPQAQGGATEDAHAGHNHGEASKGGIPAFETSATSLKKLPPTLSPDSFTGRQRIAYQMVKEIPETIAQLPCYCHCDKGFGHKSLHSCYVDDHAAHCGICVDEVITAYNMQKESKLKPEQIRERIIAQYSSSH